jgi:hypothetical protein
MSNNSIQHIRGTLAEHSTYTGRKGEISLITDSTNDRVPTGEIRIHDGVTASGLPIKLGTSSSPLTSDIYLASGSGINFDAYATSGNPSSNLLNDYEEGTWVPNIYDANGTIPFSVQYANYVKTGKNVYVTFFASGAFNYTSSGNVRVGGLPFTSDGGSFNGAKFAGNFYVRMLGSGIVNPGCVIPGGSDLIEILEMNSGTSFTANVSATQIFVFNNSSNNYFGLSIVYLTN